MSTVDTSTWNPDADLNTAIEGIPLNSDAGIAQTWKAIAILMAALKGDTSAIQALMVPFTGATASANGTQGLVPAPEAGDESRLLKGDGTWGVLSASDIPNIDASAITSGTIDLARLPAGALERLVTVADQTARFALTTADVQLGDTVKQLDTGVMYIVVDTSKLGQAAGYIEYTAGSAASVPWSGVTGKPSSYTPSSHAHGNITNAGAIGSTSGLPVVTGTNGVLQAGSFGTTAGTVCEGNDSRLSNARTPTSHTHGNITSDGKLSTASRAVVTDGNGAIDVSSVTSTELGYLSGVTSAVQTQLNAKADDSAVVHSSGNETISGEKTFNSLTITTIGNLKKTENTGELAVCGGTGASVASGAFLQLYGSARSDAPGTFLIYAGTSSSNYTRMIGKPDGTLTWGGQNIQTSSDERLKTSLSQVPDAVLDAWEDVQWGQFQHLSAINCKGESARLHLGLIAQRVKAVFEDRGLDACKYGILCYEEEEDLWMVRYTEALAMEAACQRRRADRLEARIATLEAANG